ncbi:MAG TPA: metallophosphoesterase [Ignavibacteriaceae bacterium]|jgi:predicted MPP superfamily phosphohydrolase
MSWWALRILIGVVLLILVEFYFIKRSTWLIKATFPDFNLKKIKTGKIIFLILLNLYPAVLVFSTVYRLIADNRIAPPQTFIFDYLLVYPFWILFLFMFQTGIYFLLIDIIRLIFYPIYRRKKDRFKPWVAKVMFAILIFFAVYVPVRIIYDYKTVSIRIVEFKKENLSAELDGFKLTFIGDIQADKYTDDDRLQNFIDKVNSTDPDLVLVSGDLISSTPDYINKSAEYVGKIKSKHGIYSCVGDHDNWAYREDNARSLREITEAMKQKDINFIDNSKRTLLIGYAQVCITFITNTYVETINPDLLDSLTLNNNDCDLKIFLTHQPQKNLINKAIEKDYDLFLAGHTHGGQITLLFPFIYLTPTLVETNYIRGDFYFGDPDNPGTGMMMTVTRGLGMSLAPIRYNSTPEVTLIILKTK